MPGIIVGKIDGPEENVGLDPGIGEGEDAGEELGVVDDEGEGLFE